MSTQSAEIGKLAEALAKAQGEIVGAIENAENPHFKSTYADLASVWDACRKPLSKNGLAVIQTTESEDAATVTITTLLAHSSGEWIQGKLALRPGKSDPQGIGSAITYGRRYAMAAIVGVAPVEDDDGNAATDRLPAVLPKQNSSPPIQARQATVSPAGCQHVWNPSTVKPGHEWCSRCKAVRAVPPSAPTLKPGDFGHPEGNA